MSLYEDIKENVDSSAQAYFSRAKGVSFDGMKLYWDKKDQLFRTKDGFTTSVEELARRVTDIINSEGLSALHMYHEIRTFTPSPNQLKGFSTAVYGKKVSKQIKRNPVKTGKKMQRAYREMI